MSELKKRPQKLDYFLKKAKNIALLKAAFSTLICAKLLKIKDGKYSLTTSGHSIAEHIGILTLPLVGYRKLIEKQFDLLNKPNYWSDSEIDYQTISLSSIQFGGDLIDQILIDLFRFLNPKGTICDFGCGTGSKLIELCKINGVSGLGLEKSEKVIEKSKVLIQENSKIEIIQADIEKLEGVWEDVEIGLISFVLHDISPEKNCVQFLTSLKKHFPRMRCFIVVDAVSMSEDLSILPGFDYVHGLQGITPRTYQETKKVFEDAKFNVFKEISIENMPNTFVWVLEIKRI